MYYYKIKIQYAGTNYSGFQFLPDLKTVQGEINFALTKIINGKVTTFGASRTDTGVHAHEQIVKVSSEFEIVNLANLLNENLPTDIRCLKSESCDGDFHPSADAMTKEYRYFFTNKKQSASVPFIVNFANPLDIEKMQMCMRLLIGEHNFCNFYSQGSNVKSSMRTIHRCELSIVLPSEFLDKKMFATPNEECFQFLIVGNGFLKQMIRHIVSGLWMVGSGKMSVTEFAQLLDGEKSKKQLWKVAPANGLFLYKINY